jgi:hypothetical protein
MEIRAWKDEDDPTYIVQVGDEMYEMSSDAHMPNGVCIYQGTARDLAWTVRRSPVHEVPLGIVKWIAYRVQDAERWGEKV